MAESLEQRIGDLEGVVAVLRGQVANLANLDQKILLSSNEAAGLLGISRATFYRRVQDGHVPKPRRIRGCARWRRSEIIRAIR